MSSSNLFAVAFVKRAIGFDHVRAVADLAVQKFKTIPIVISKE